MAKTPWEDWSAIQWRDIVPGAQTRALPAGGTRESGSAGQWGTYLMVRASPAAFRAVYEVRLVEMGWMTGERLVISSPVRST